MTFLWFSRTWNNNTNPLRPSFLRRNGKPSSSSLTPSCLQFSNLLARTTTGKAGMIPVDIRAVMQLRSSNRPVDFSHRPTLHHQEWQKSSLNRGNDRIRTLSIESTGYLPQHSITPPYQTNADSRSWIALCVTEIGTTCSTHFVRCVAVGR
jgi:hypothetical protein